MSGLSGGVRGCCWLGREDRLETRARGGDEVMRGSQKFEDGFEELMGNWSESSFLPGASPLRASVPPSVGWGRKSLLAGAPAEALGGLGPGCSRYTVVVVVMYYLSASPVAEQGPGVECHLRVWVPFCAGPCDGLFVVSTCYTRHFTWVSPGHGEPSWNPQGSSPHLRGLLQGLFL